MKVQIYEVEYSVSPGGEDAWGVNILGPQGGYLVGIEVLRFDNAGQALNKILSLYPEHKLEVEVKSLEWLRAQEALGIEDAENSRP